MCVCERERYNLEDQVDMFHLSHQNTNEFIVKKQISSKKMEG